MTDYSASSEAEIESALALVVAGDTITVDDGTYTNMTLNTAATANGTAASPITLRAANKHGAVLGGATSIIAVRSDYLIVDGFKFDNISGDPVARLDGATNSFFKNCLFDTCGTLSVDENIRIEGGCVGGGIVNCAFSSCPQLAIAVFATAANQNVGSIIRGNYFDSSTGSDELIQIGQTAASPDETTLADVSFNVFNACAGGSELISNKSSFNTYAHNTFIECTAPLTIRRGENCTIKGNTFIGTQIRVYGDSNIVVGNTFYSKAGTAIDLDCGTGTASDAEYPQSTSAFYQNTVVDNTSGFAINGSYTVTTREQLPTNTITNNSLRSNVTNINVIEQADSNTYLTNTDSASATELRNSSTGDLRLNGGSVDIAAGTKWWAGNEAPVGQDGLRFYMNPSIGAYEYRPDTGGINKTGSMPIGTLPAGMDVPKIRMTA